MDKILKVIPRERRTFLFSATMTKKVGQHWEVFWSGLTDAACDMFLLLLCSVLLASRAAGLPVKLTSIPPHAELHIFLLRWYALVWFQVQKLQRAALKDPVKCAVSTKYSTVDKLQQYYIFIPSKYKVQHILPPCFNVWNHMLQAVTLSVPPSLYNGIHM